MATEPFWAHLEIMGHVQHYGLVSEVQFAGVTLCRVQVPDGKDGWLCEKRYGGGAIFCVTPCTEEYARARARYYDVPTGLLPAYGTGQDVIRDGNVEDGDFSHEDADEPEEDEIVECLAGFEVPAERLGVVHGDEDCASSCYPEGEPGAHHWVEKQSMSREDGDTTAEHRAEKMNLGLWFCCLHCDVWAEVKA